MDRKRSRFGRVVETIMNPVVDAVEPDELLDRIDVNALLDRIDVNALLDRVDLERLLDRVDVDALLDRVDVDAIVKRAGIEELIQRSTRGVVSQLLDLARRQLVGLDVVLTETVAAVGRRKPEPAPSAIQSMSGRSMSGQSMSGTTAGATTRLAAFAIDSVFVTLLFGLGVSITEYVANLILTKDWRPERGSGVVWIVLILTWSVMYFVSGWTIAGRTPGMGIIGLRVVRDDRRPISFGAALVRIIVFPAVFVAGLGAAGIVLGRRHRALHDVAARSLVVYDWGERAAGAPAPLTRWLSRHGVDLAETAGPGRAL